MIKRTTKKIINRIDLSMYQAGLRSVEKLSLPTFLGLGPGQSGTTWLFKHLSKHPDVFMPERKEVHYFDLQFDQWPLAYYASLFEHPTKTVRGECSPGYSILPLNSIALIGKLMPHLKLILILRNPVERSWSSLRRLIGKQHKTLADYNETTLLNVLDKEWMYDGPEFPALEGDYADGVLEGHYSRAINNWLSVFNEDQLLIAFFDDLQQNPTQFLTSVCHHIGVEPAPIVENTNLDKKVNANPSSPLPPMYEQFLIKKYRLRSSNFSNAMAALL